jgi:hypothetical protein
MTHPQLRLAAAKFALELTDMSDLYDASHAALDDAVYAQFAAALRDLGHTFTSQEDALRYLRLSFFGPVAEGVVSPDDGFAPDRAERPLFDNWSTPSTGNLHNHWVNIVPLEHNNVTEAWQDWDTKTVQLCREWCREYARLYLQPAWRSETVIALASAIHAERAYDRLPILADALEEAGCDHPDLLGHCRHDTPHTDYCWLVDALNGVTREGEPGV